MKNLKIRVTENRLTSEPVSSKGAPPCSQCKSGGHSQNSMGMQRNKE